MEKCELLKFQLEKREMTIVDEIRDRGEVSVNFGTEGIVIIEVFPEDIINLKKYLRFCGYSYMLRIRKTKAQILVKM